eukprot:CAMPEP_0194488474 /NCGR_PEP_ID=MMETSP0253-20130528/8387_1 /TAXON_ID=2966 /ORGANISM="Noctiluca scintillans" /LENGTH=124 /DNA_ID=CAMNT_0039328845 /DNA_START=71 /DNA_END=445 /DNA_ORIENTATION=-
MCGVHTTCCNRSNSLDERDAKRSKDVKVKRRSSDSPATMLLTFELPNGSITEVAFSERPLGMKFTPSVPLTVTEVKQTGQASKLGIKDGWMLICVDSEAMNGKSSEYVIGVLCKKASVLPLLYL